MGGLQAGRLQVDKSRRVFLRENKPFFYLADTIWSAFTNVTFEEWEFYLNKRKSQGFNVLQINILPQWDRCLADVGIYPMQTVNGLDFCFTGWNEEYFERSSRMCEMAAEKGFELALVMLWVNYVPGTWGSRMLGNNIMPSELVESYTEKVVEVFDRFAPIYIVSGDADFDTPEAILYYTAAMNKLCELSPKSLKSLHIKRGYNHIPEELEEKVDFYMYQSGHNAKGQDQAYKLADDFYKREPVKPVINSEPCYEQMGYSRQIYGRFDRFAVRKAAWTSLLSGACAGVTYGAHGVWNWHKLNKPANPIMGEGFDAPLPWEEALALPGAWDYGKIKYILDMYHCYDLVPFNHILQNNTSEIRAAKANGHILLYVPYNTQVILKTVLENHEAVAIDLEEGRIGHLQVIKDEKSTKISMHLFTKDVLIVLRKL